MPQPRAPKKIWACDDNLYSYFLGAAMTDLMMEPKQKRTIADFFENVKDPRVERTKRHKLIDIITIAICAVICGAETWIAIETYGQEKQEWLGKFLELSNGIP